MLPFVFALMGLALLFVLLPTGQAGAAPPVSPRQHPFTQIITPTAVGQPPNIPFPSIIITAIEPGQINSETGGTLSVYGNGFTAGSVIRVVGIGIIPTTFINNEALTGQIPPGAPPGIYNVQVGLGNEDGPNAVVNGALQIIGPTATPVPSATPTSASFVFGQPQLTIDQVQISPAALQPGQPFELQMVLANSGNWTAVDIELALQSTDIAVPAAGSNVRIIPRIQYENSITLTLPLILGDVDLSGPQNLTFNMTYFDINGGSYTTQQSVGINVSNTTATPTPAASQPRLVLTTYGIEPEGELAPGDSFVLTLNLTNVGDATTSDVLITLGGESGAALQPFALLNSSNIRYIESVGAGETVELQQTMLVAGNAASGVFTLPIDLSYDGTDGTPLTGTQVINLLVEKPPQFQVNFYRPVQLGFVDQPLDLPIEVVNIGRSLINISTIAVTSPEMTMENNSIYVGPLDGGTSGSIDAVGFPQTGGMVDVLVSVNYLDDFNQPQIYEQTLSVEVEAPPEDAVPVEGEDGEITFTQVPLDGSGNGDGSEGDERPFLLRLLMGLLGLGS